VRVCTARDLTTNSSTHRHQHSHTHTNTNTHTHTHTHTGLVKQAVLFRGLAFRFLLGFGFRV